MGKLNIFTISFANTAAVFYAGTMVQGHVTIELKEPMKMRGRLEYMNICLTSENGLYKL